ncbi:MAG: large conductance mechanosensitive channel protein MscL [Oscillospiraceae bacterium]|nr:large conductance mechanosensitive channel protein MscL [Oscillospiraceae bacterium]
MSKKNGKPSLFQEFKSFINKGNAMALAVGTIIGGAFSGITKSVTNDLIMPIINIFMGGTDFSELKIELPRIVPVYEDVLNEAGEVIGQEYVPHYLTYGNFISAVINFLIMALVVFFIVKAMNKMTETATRRQKAAEEAAAAAAAAAAAEEAAKNPPAPTSEELLAEIRDLLKNK